MTQDERDKLEKEWKELSDRLSDARFPDPKDIRRKEEITSLLMTNGENANIKFKFVKGRKATQGLSTKGYNRKGPVG